MSAPVDAVAEIECAIDRAHAHRLPELRKLYALRTAVAELIAADVEYDAAAANKRAVYRRWNQEHDPAFATDEEFAVLSAADARLEAASLRRRDALAATQGCAA